MKTTHIISFVIVTAAAAIIWAVTQDWYEGRRAAALAAGVPSGAAPGPVPSLS